LIILSLSVMMYYTLMKVAIERGTSQLGNSVSSIENIELEFTSTPETENEILRQRKEKLQRLREEEGYDPYKVEKWDRRHTLLEVSKRYGGLSPDEKASDVEIRTAGRLLTLRRQGKATFADLA